jgi:hypothetical protein
MIVVESLSTTMRRPCRLCDLRVLELQAHLFGDHLGAREDRDVLEHPLAASPTRRLDGDGWGPRSLLTTIVASDSPSTSSATIAAGDR